VKMEDPLSQSSKEIEKSAGSFSWRTVLGMLSCMVACCFFSCMNGLSKYLYNISNITAWEIVYWRSLALVIYNVITAQLSGSSTLAIPKN
jgi:hypothetical protein